MNYLKSFKIFEKNESGLMDCLVELFDYGFELEHVEEGKPTPDASFEKLGELSNLRTFRLNGAPINFQQEPFFCNLSKVKQLESLELRMNFRQLGVLTERSIKCLSKLKSLKRLNLPNQYPAEEYIKLQQLLPNCEIVINMSPEGD